MWRLTRVASLRVDGVSIGDRPGHALFAPPGEKLPGEQLLWRSDDQRWRVALIHVERHAHEAIRWSRSAAKIELIRSGRERGKPMRPAAVGLGPSFAA